MTPPDPDLDNRRAIFVYEAARLHAQQSGAPIVPEHWGDRDGDFRAQFVEKVAELMDPSASLDPKKLHDDWCGETRDPQLKTHPDLVPFDDLPPREQIKDQVFAVLCVIAREAIGA